MKLVRLVVSLALAGALTSCGHDLDGPVPEQNQEAPEGSVEPQAVCVEQITTTVTVRGSGISPMPIKTMESKPQLALPEVALALSKDLKGSAASAAPSVIYDDPAQPDLSKLHWKSQEEMTFDVYPELQLPVGLHTIRLTNANGHAGEWPDALLAVPRPKIESITPDVICSDKQAELVIIGSFIRKQGNVFPKVTAALGKEENPAVLAVSEMDECEKLPGGANLEQCKKLVVLVPAAKLTSGETYKNYAITVTNPSPVGCHSEDQATLTVVPPPKVTEINPDIICPTGNGKEITITGSGFLVVGGQNPSVAVASTSLAPVPSDCSPVTGPRESVDLCTTLKVTIPTSSSAGLQQLTVTNPDPAGCISAEAALYISAPPALTAIWPTAICSSTANTVAVQGTDLLVIGGVAPTLAVDTEAVAVTPTGCLPVQGLREGLEICSRLTFDVAKDSLDEGTHQVSVANPAPADCAAGTTLPLEVVPPPTITTVTPSKICIGGGTLTITGTHFRTGLTTVTLGGKAANTVTVTDSDNDPANDSVMQIAATFSSGALPPVSAEPYDVEVKNAEGCSATLADAVRVTEGPQLFFVDPPVVYNGISTKVTLYGSGFTGTVQEVSIQLAGSGAAPTVLADLTFDPAWPNRAQVVIPKDTAAGTYDIFLRDETTCAATLLGGLTVVDEETLTLTKITPSFGYTGATTAVTVNADPADDGGLKAGLRLYLNSTTPGESAAPLGSVVFLGADSVTAVVPKGLQKGTYDLIAVNPDGGVAVLDGAFKVTEQPPPVLVSISPGSIPSQASQPVKVTGQNFRSPSASLRCLNVGTGLEVPNTPAVSSSTATEVNLLVDASTLTDGAVCVVRVTNGDDQSFGELSALVITNPAENLSTFAAGRPLAVARHALAAVSNQATSAARYIYAIGGDDGTSAGVLRSVDSAPVDIFGRPSDFSTQAYGLDTARSYIGAATVGRCIYVVGGFDGSQPLPTIERACVLDPANRPEIVDLDLEAVGTGGLGHGLYYYQVAAVMPDTYAMNPGGQTLPSEPFPLLLPTLSNNRQLNVTLHWSAVSGAVGYRIYRSPTAGATSNALTLIATVDASSPTPTRYTDSGATAGSDRPLALGSTGKWYKLPQQMATARQGAGVAIAPDPADTTGTKFYLYAMGGKSASAALSSYEYMPITINADGSQSVSDFVTGSASLGAARWQLAAYSVGNREASYVTAPAHYVYAGPGVASNGTAMVGDVEAFLVGANGELGAPDAVDATSPARAGYGYAAANNFLYAFGGAQAGPETTAKQAKLCQSSGGGCGGGVPQLVNWNNATSLQVARYLMGSTIQSGFIYILGGKTTTENATTSTEYTIW